MKAIKISTDDVISVVDIQEPTLEGIHKHVGGFMEIVRPWGFMKLEVPEKEKLCMIVNEEGRLIGLDLNEVGSFIYNDTPAPFSWEPIVGDVLIMAEGFVDGEPDIVGLDDTQIDIVKAALKGKFEYLTEEENAQ